MDRRHLLRSAAFAAPMLALGRGNAGAAAAKGMNVLLFLTDQERTIQHFPRGWEARNLPATRALRRNGVSFDNAFCPACMCSPSRASLLTGSFPAQHGVVDTLSFGHDVSEDQPLLPPDLPNLGSILAAAGYDVAYKGKWHVSKPLANPKDDEDWSSKDTEVYGFDRWNFPDAGGDASIPEMGGGRADHDRRFVEGEGRAEDGEEGVLQFLKRQARANRPFFLTVSLVNPHDVLAYPRRFPLSGYGAEWLRGEIDLPETWDEDLAAAGKPTAQVQLVGQLDRGLGPLKTPEEARNYLNFYGNLMRLADSYLARILRMLRKTGLLEDTLVIKTSDHGEMGLAHGGLRQKMFNVYEETLRVPLVYSNPRLFPRGRRADALVSHVDLLPTLTSLVGAVPPATVEWKGKDYSGLVPNPVAAPVQDHVVFTYDDLYCGQADILVGPPNRIAAIREERYKLARYYDGDGAESDQWEMYDLKADPLEKVNIAGPAHTPTIAQRKELDRLKKKLAEVETERLAPL